MAKKDFAASKICICFASAMTAISLMLNTLLYRESLMTDLKKTIDKRFLLDTPDISTIHEVQENDESGKMIAIDRSDIVERIRSYNNILNISRLKSVINTLLLAGLGLAGVFGIFGFVKNVLRDKE